MYIEFWVLCISIFALFLVFFLKYLEIKKESKRRKKIREKADYFVKNLFIYFTKTPGKIGEKMKPTTVKICNSSKSGFGNLCIKIKNNIKDIDSSVRRGKNSKNSFNNKETRSSKFLKIIEDHKNNFKK